jgi:hypothetical protein
VVDRLRLLLNRPLRDSDRPRLLAVAVVVIMAAAGMLALSDGAHPGTPAVRTPVAAPTPVLGDDNSVAAVPGPSPTPQATPGEEGRPSRQVEGSRADVTAAKRVARRFLAGYLPYSYGRRRPAGIAAATGRLRRRLAAQRPRVPARERRRHARLVLVQSDTVTHRHAVLLALIGDGARRYTLRLELDRQPRRGWLVTDAGT